jgi:hypothetical protein
MNKLGVLVELVVYSVYVYIRSRFIHNIYYIFMYVCNMYSYKYVMIQDSGRRHANDVCMTTYADVTDFMLFSRVNLSKKHEWLPVVQYNTGYDTVPIRRSTCTVHAKSKFQLMANSTACPALHIIQHTWRRKEFVKGTKVLRVVL